MTKIKDKSASYGNSEVPEKLGSQLPSSTADLGSRIGEAADRLGTRKSAADAMGVSVDSLARYIRGENVPPFDVAARLCLAASCSMEWLATGNAEEVAPSQPVKLETLTIAVQLAQEALDGDVLDPPDYGQLVTLIYDALVHGLPSAQVIALARPAARGLQGGSSSGEAGEAVGRTGRGVAR